MPNVPAFERDARLRRLDTEVVASGDDGGRPYVVLADTVLYPEGGGQPADRGTVAGVAVVDVQRVEGQIRHVLAGPVPSGPVTVELDWERRFEHMQQHTAQHLLTAVADARFGWRTTAFHLGEERSDIELDATGIGVEQLADLEEAVAAEIRAARAVTAQRVEPEEYARLPVRSRGLPAGHTGSIRLVEIEGIDLNTCGGTHCASTAELEGLKLLGTESLRGGTRLFYAAGGRLRRILGAHYTRTAELRSLLGVGDDEIVSAVQAKMGQLKDAQRTIRGLEQEVAVAEAEVLAARAGAVHAMHWPDKGLPFLQQVARELERLSPTKAVLLTCGEGEDGAFVLAAGPRADVDVAQLGPRVAEVLGGRGGGSGRMYQGKVSRLSGRDEAARVVGAGA